VALPPPFCRDGTTAGSAYDEEHKKDTCLLRGPQPDTGSGTYTVAGLFAVSLASVTGSVPLLCELDDTDADGVTDNVDVCPHTAPNSEDHVLANGCSKMDIDPDFDGVCSFATPGSDNRFCSGGPDNCPLVKNPDQTLTVAGATLGDACNTGECLLLSVRWRLSC